MAIWDTQSTWLNGYTAKFSITLQVERRTGANGGLTLVVPYVNPAPGMFTLVVGGGVSKTGQARMNFYFMAEDNLGLFMSKNRCDYAQELRGRHNLAGETGLRVWFVSVIDGINKARIVKQTTGFSYNLDFLTTLEGHIRPSFRTVYPSGRIFSGAFDVNHNRQDKNTLNVAFAPYSPPVPFAETDLGEALARIEAELRQARTKEADADRRRNVANETMRSQQFQALSADQRAVQRAQEVKAEADLQDARTTIRNLQSERATLRASAATAAAAAAAGSSLSTQQQLNNLITLDAIRDITR